MLNIALFLVACDNAPAPEATPPKTETPPADATPHEHAHPERPTLPAPPDVAAAPADATTTPSGLAYKVLKKGTGTDHPAATDKVLVDYTGWTTDGQMFDSSVVRKQPISFALDGVIAGWTEGVQLMSPGDQFRFWIPEALAYKGQGKGPKGMLVFDVELQKILPSKIPAPPDVKAPPKDATKTSSGLAYKVIEQGKGTAHPAATSMVEVDYTGWKTDGEMFDSSLTRGTSTTFPLNRVIPGWTEGVQLMREGDTFRFWIPEELAYKGNARGPQGMLVFDVKLIAIKAP
jgi:FKBP-type peptidyl-prolyl cis-trans isomerase